MPWGISDKHKFVFVHIPKTAGCAICAFLKDVMYVGSNHATISDIEKWYYKSALSPFKNQSAIYFERFRPFAVIRNPYDRFALGFFFRKGKRIGRRLDGFGTRLLIESGKFDSLKTQHSWIDKTCRLIKYEDLVRGLNEFMEDVGLDRNAKDMPIVHAIGIQEVFDDYFTPEIKAVVESCYKEDFELWESL